MSSSLSSALTTIPKGSQSLLVAAAPSPGAQTPRRTSSLASPIVRLDAHAAPVHAVKFSPSGQHLASVSFDRSVQVWSVGGECKNWAVLQGHRNAILNLEWTHDSTYIVTASADHTLALYDLATSGARVRQFKGHAGVVSQVATTNRGSGTLVLSGSDDGHVLVWDMRQKQPVDRMATNLPVCAMAADLGSGELVFTGSVDNLITAWDFRAKKCLFALSGHADTVVGLKLSPDRTCALSVSLDATARVWDVKPFSAIPGRMLSVLPGLVSDSSRSTQILPSWSPDGALAASGSLGDCSIVVWDVAKQSVLYKLPGHRGGVTCVDFHPSEAIIASSALDGTVYLGELGV